MITRKLPQQERRALDTRPRNGDVKPCRACAGRSEFDQRYRIDGYVVPAWVCETPKCRAEIVRTTSISASAASREVLEGAKQVQAHARRTMMKSKARVERTQKRLDQTDAKLKLPAS